MKYPTKIAIVMTVIATVLTACNFHLRTEINLPQTVSIVSDDHELVAILSAELKQHGTKILPSSPTKVTFQNATATRRVLTTDITGRANGYRLHYNATFTVTDDGDGNDDGDEDDNGNESINLTRIINYNANNELQAEREIELLTTEMRREVTARVIQYLNHR